METINTPQNYVKKNMPEEPVSVFLDKLFPEQEYRDKTVKRALGILGDDAGKFSVDEIQTMVAETEYLCEALLDIYEKQIFNGKTLQELLNEG